MNNGRQRSPERPLPRAKSRIVVRCVTAVVIGVCYWIGGVGSVAADGPPTGGDRIDALVRQIGDDAFDVRERAAAELLSMGPGIVGSLLSRMDSETDRETLLRLSDIAGRLQRRNDAVMQRRFLARLENDLPGWRWFGSLMGDTDASRELFVEMHRRYPNRIGLLDGSSRDRGTLMRRTLEDIQPIIGGDPGRLLPMDLLMLLLPMPDASLTPDAKVDQAVQSLIGIGVHRSLLADRNTRGGTERLIGRWINRPNDAKPDARLLTGLRLRLPQTAALARRVLRDAQVVDRPLTPQERIRQAKAGMPASGSLRTAIAVLSVHGDRPDVALLKPWMKDQRPASGRTIRRGKSLQATLGDCAAAAIVRLAGIDPEDVGLDRASVGGPYGVSADAVGFPVDDPEARSRSRQRIAAHRLLREQ